MTRERVQVADGRWIKSVRWMDGIMKAKSAALTCDEREAATFLPQHAATLRAQFGPAAVAAAKARHEAAVRAAAHAFADALDAVSKEMGRDVRQILKDVL